MKINNFRGDLTDMSAKKEALVCTVHNVKLRIECCLCAEEFASMWATPSNVELEGLCRAHHIPFQRVTDPNGLQPALQTAWSLNAPSVVEVITDRSTNVEAHRCIQRACNSATRRTLECLLPTLPYAASYHNVSSTVHERSSAPHSETQQNGMTDVAAGIPDTGVSLSISEHDSDRQVISQHASSSGQLLYDASLQHVVVEDLTWRPFQIQLAKPVTTGANSGIRSGFIVTIRISVAGSVHVTAHGEVAPLPGLHVESLEDAEAQLQLLSMLLPGTRVPVTAAMLDGAFDTWWQQSVGVSIASVAPSVQFGIESALLSALATAERRTMSALLRCCVLPFQSSATGEDAASSASSTDATPPRVLVNALLDASSCSPAEAYEEALLLAAAGYICVKVKVARRGDPREDAAVLAEIRRAVGPTVAIRADANRKWSLPQALDFASALKSHDIVLEYIEEPVARPMEVCSYE